MTKHFEVAIAYTQANLCVLPANLADKRPDAGNWKQYQNRLPTDDELRRWFKRDRPMCLVAGPASNDLEMIDFDCGGEKFVWWRYKVELQSPGLVDQLVLERSPSGGWHAVYRHESDVYGNLKLAERQVVVPENKEYEFYGKKYKPAKVGNQYVIRLTVIETRGEGGIFLCDPTPGYTLTQGRFEQLPVLTEEQRMLLLETAWSLTELKHEPEPEPEPKSTSHAGADSDGRPGDDFNESGDIRPVLRAHGWTLKRKGDNEYWCRPGKSHGTSATLKDNVFYVFSTNAFPFEPGRGYSNFHVYTLLEHGKNEWSAAAAALRQQGYGNPYSAPAVRAGAAQPVDDPPPKSESPNPGPIPDSLLHVPGFVDDVMRYSLENAPYPSVPLAFCGAMALQSFLCGRKICDVGDLRPNVYLLALASSGTGKDFPRKVNSRVLFEIGHTNSLGDKFASGEGIQDALARNYSMLFQNDEMDGVLRQINLDRESKRESIPNILLTLYTSASEVYPIRTKANQKGDAQIDQPHLTLFGTATPQYFYESLSHRMLTNGFFARMIIIDVGKRGEGQAPGSTRQLPESILRIAHWWADFQPGSQRKNLLEVHPEPRVVPYTAEAIAAVGNLQRLADSEYDKAHAQNDEVARVAWSRTCENAKKLALLYACSANYEQPEIDLAAVQWATEFAMHQTRRQLYLATIYVAENPFHAECLKLMRTLKEAGGQMARNRLMRAMRCKMQDFDQMVTTLMTQGDIVLVEIATKTKPAIGYRLT